MDTQTVTIIGHQLLACRNPACAFLLKRISYTSAGEQIVTGGRPETRFELSDGTVYYECPRCRARNYVAAQSEGMLLETIVGWEQARCQPRELRSVTVQASDQTDLLHRP